MARNFDGTNDTLKDTSATGTIAGTKSFALWFKTSAGGLMFNANGSTSQRNIIRDNTSTLSFFQDWTGINGFWRGSTTITGNTWMNGVITYNDTSSSNDPAIYVNNNTETVTEINAPTISVVNTVDEILFGENTAGTADYDGDLFCFVAWSIILTSTEIQALSNGVHPFVIRHDSQVYFFPMTGNDSPEGDYSAQVNQLTVSGSTKSTTNPPVELLENYL